MRQRNLKFLLVTLLVASGLLFAGGEAQANFTAFKYTLTSSGAVPPPPPNNGTYTWVFAPVPGSSSTQIKNIVFEVPVEIPYTQLITPGKLTVDYYLTSTPVPLTFAVYKPGDGEPESRLGLGDFRYSVVSINPPPTSFSKNGFTLVIKLTGVTLSSTMLQLSATQKQVVQLKSSSATSDSDTAIAPSVENIPPPPPPSALNATISANPSTIGYGAGFGGAHIECTNLTWNTTPNAEIVAISGVGMVRGSGPDVNPVNVCPKDNTTYKITAILGTLVVDNTTTVTVIPPPPPVIEASVETVEKKDETGAVTGYVTFYSMDGVLQCSCSTGPDKVADPILPYEIACFDPNTKCTPASIADLIPPLVCIRVQTGPPTPGNTCTAEDSDLCYTFTTGDNKLYKCDIWALQTRDTIVEIGKKSCTCGWTTTRDRYGKTVSVWTCSGSTCAACSYKTCP